MQDGLRRMYAEQESVFYYITVMNENYAHPAMPKGVEQGILRGMYLLHIGGRGAVRATLLGSGTILREALAAAELLESEFGIPADVMSVTSFSELRRDALAAEREAMLRPGDKPRQPWVRECLAGRQGPFVAATDYMKAVADQIRQWVPGRYVIARHRRLRPQRRARGAARPLRGGSSLDRGGRAQGARRRRPDRPLERDARHQEVRHRSGQARPAGELTCDGRTTVVVPDLGEFQRRRSHRGTRQGGRHGRSRGAADHARDRQGDDGRPLECGRPRRRGRGEEGRPRLERVAGCRRREFSGCARIEVRLRGESALPPRSPRPPRSRRPRRLRRRSRCACRTSATSRTSKSSRSW